MDSILNDNMCDLEHKLQENTSDHTINIQLVNYCKCTYETQKHKIT